MLKMTDVHAGYGATPILFGCVLYTVNRSPEDPRKFLLYEQYVDRAGYDAHMATEPFKENILGKVVPMLESRVRNFYEVVEP